VKNYVDNKIIVRTWTSSNSWLWAYI
jgi:hypothetical protein